MIPPDDFINALTRQGIRRFTGVPCSFFQASILCVLDREELEYTLAPNEGSALAIAAGAYLAGQSTALFIQNSGFGNLINPLTSLCMIYRIPVLIFMSGRAYGVPDEPQHEIIGRTMTDMLKAMGVRYAEMPQEPAAFEKTLREARAYLESAKQPFFFIVKKDTLSEYKPDAKKGAYPMKRIQAIERVTDCLVGEELVVATTGKPSRELFTVKDRPENFYMQGSMGHAASIGLGVALARPDRKVVVLDGDGAALMHMGIFSSVGHYRPGNFYHVVLDNEAYETTGNQDTTSATTDLAAAALACGYSAAETVVGAEELTESFRKMLAAPGPSFLRVKINRQATEGIGRISSRYVSPQIAENFKSQCCR